MADEMPLCVKIPHDSKHSEGQGHRLLVWSGGCVKKVWLFFDLRLY